MIVTSPARIVKTGALAIDLDALTVAVGGREIHLTPNERRIVLLLANRAGQIVPAHEIVAEVWGPEYVVGTLTAYANTLRAHLNRCRPKLGAAGSLVETLPGFGYRLVLKDQQP